MVFAEPLPRARQSLEHRGAQAHSLVAVVRPAAGVELLERRLEILRRGAVRVALERASSRLREIAERLAMRRARAGAREVVRQLVGVRRCALAVHALQRIRDLGVESLRPRAAERRVHDVAHERVREIVLVVAGGLVALHEQPRAPQLVERLEDHLVRLTAHRAQRGVPHARSEHRGEIEQRARRAAEPLDASQHRVAYGARQRDRLDVPSRPPSVALLQLPRLDERLDRLLDEERIAARPLVQHRREAAHDVGGHLERAPHQLERLLGRQRRDPLDARRTQRDQRLLGVAQQRGHRVRVVVRAEHEQSSAETRARAPAGRRSAADSSDAASAHCRLSSTSSSGWRAESRPSSWRKVQYSRAFASAALSPASARSPRAGASTPGKMCASSALAPRVRTVSADGSSRRSMGPRASANTAYGTPDSTE